MILRQLRTGGWLPLLAHYFGFGWSDVYTTTVGDINAMIDAMPDRKGGTDG